MLVINRGLTSPKHKRSTTSNELPITTWESPQSLLLGDSLHQGQQQLTIAILIKDQTTEQESMNNKKFNHCQFAFTASTEYSESLLCVTLQLMLKYHSYLPLFSCHFTAEHVHCESYVIDSLYLYSWMTCVLWVSPPNMRLKEFVKEELAVCVHNHPMIWGLRKGKMNFLWSSRIELEL